MTVPGVYRSPSEEQPRKPSPVARAVGLERAAELLGKGGQREIADALGIEPRTLRYKTNEGRPISKFDLTQAADLCAARGAKLIELAGKLREEAGR